MKSMKIKVPNTKPFNMVAKDVLTPKYRMRVATSKKAYNRKADKRTDYEYQ
jgi:hypothetical protein